MFSRPWAGAGLPAQPRLRLPRGAVPGLGDPGSQSSRRRTEHGFPSRSWEVCSRLRDSAIRPLSGAPARLNAPCLHSRRPRRGARAPRRRPGASRSGLNPIPAPLAGWKNWDGHPVVGAFTCCCNAELSKRTGPVLDMGSLRNYLLSVGIFKGLPCLGLAASDRRRHLTLRGNGPHCACT